MQEESDRVYKDERFGRYREVLFSYDKDGNYVSEVKFHGESDRIVWQQALDEVETRIEKARQKVLNGEASPILYHMEKMLLNPSDLSIHTGFMLWRVKWHLKPRVFSRLSKKTLNRYSEVFNIPPDQLGKVE